MVYAVYSKTRELSTFDLVLELVPTECLSLLHREWQRR